jgi:hypothetical protein
MNPFEQSGCVHLCGRLCFLRWRLGAVSKFLDNYWGKSTEWVNRCAVFNFAESQNFRHTEATNGFEGRSAILASMSGTGPF